MMGCIGMLKNIDNLKKKNYSALLIVFILFFLIIFIVNIVSSTVATAGSVSYTPAPPAGNTSGNVDMFYEYVVSTIDTGSHWMFNWGDGTYSSWVEVGESDNSVSQTHSWNFPGVYEVRIKHRSIYNVESAWSPPLIVEIVLDSDMDGWVDEAEYSYGTSSTDPDDYPFDTDSDGVPDDDSPDGKYIGDDDDDNDGIADVIELQLGSNPKNVLDITKIGISGVSYYLVDVTEDGKSDLFYNTALDRSSTVKIADGGVYLVDFDGNGQWDYTYNPVYKTVTYYEEFSVLPWLLLALGIFIGALIVVFLLFKTGVLFLYEEYVVEE